MIERRCDIDCRFDVGWLRRVVLMSVVDGRRIEVARQ
jgi:hypothetical protein